MLGPGLTAAPERNSLALLPSGPDAVRRLPVRGTRPSTLRAWAQAPEKPAPRAVFGPAGADCGFREPLAPRLARPGGASVLATCALRARSSAGERPRFVRALSVCSAEAERLSRVRTRQGRVLRAASSSRTWQCRCCSRRRGRHPLCRTHQQSRSCCRCPFESTLNLPRSAIRVTQPGLVPSQSDR